LVTTREGSSPKPSGAVPTRCSCSTEIEKAHRDVLEAFLGVFDEGRLTDGRGKTVDFTNTVIILTSNLGADEIRSRGSRAIGFGNSATDRIARVENTLVAAARAALPPELYNRIDEVIAFAPLERAEVAEIARRLLSGLASMLKKSRGVLLDVDDEAIDVLLDSGGFDVELGARPMKRTLARLVEAPIRRHGVARRSSRGRCGAPHSRGRSDRRRRNQEPQGCILSSLRGPYEH